MVFLRLSGAPYLRHAPALDRVLSDTGHTTAGTLFVWPIAQHEALCQLDAGPQIIRVIASPPASTPAAGATFSVKVTDSQTPVYARPATTTRSLLQGSSFPDAAVLVLMNGLCTGLPCDMHVGVVLYYWAGTGSRNPPSMLHPLNTYNDSGVLSKFDVASYAVGAIGPAAGAVGIVVALSPLGIFWHSWDAVQHLVDPVARRIDNATGADWMTAASVTLADVDGDGLNDVVAAVQYAVERGGVGAPDIVWFKQVLTAGVAGAGAVTWVMRGVIGGTQLDGVPPVVAVAAGGTRCNGGGSDVLVGSTLAHTVMHASNGGLGAVTGTASTGVTVVAGNVVTALEVSDFGARNLSVAVFVDGHSVVCGHGFRGGGARVALVTTVVATFTPTSMTVTPPPFQLDVGAFSGAAAPDVVAAVVGLSDHWEIWLFSSTVLASGSTLSFTSTQLVAGVDGTLGGDGVHVTALFITSAFPPAAGAVAPALLVVTSAGSALVYAATGAASVSAVPRALAGGTVVLASGCVVDANLHQYMVLVASDGNASIANFTRVSAYLAPLFGAHPSATTMTWVGGPGGGGGMPSAAGGWWSVVSIAGGTLLGARAMRPDDAQLDIVLSFDNHGGIYVLVGQSATAFAARPLRVAVGVDATGAAVAITDWNADGLPDIIASGVSWTAAFLNVGDGTFMQVRPLCSAAAAHCGCSCCSQCCMSWAQ